MHPLGPERVHADRRRQRGVDAARDPEHDVAEAVLLHVVADTEPEREPHLLELRLERDDRAGRDGSLCPRRRQLHHGYVGPSLAGALELAPPHVAQPPADRLRRVDVDHEQRLLEAGRPGDHLPLVVEHDRVPVEDELVLPSHQVAEGEIRRVVAGARDQHLLPLLGLADVERRGGDVHEQLHPRQGEVGGGRARLPDVLAHRRPDQHVAHAQREQLPAFGEVAVLVEDAVVRQEVLAVDGADLPAAEHGARVREVTVEEGAADEGRDPVGRAGDLLERGPRSLEKPRTQQQVLGRVAGHGQLREHDEIGACPPRVGERREDPGAVAVEIPDHGVELGEREPHGRILTIAGGPRGRHVFDREA